MRTRFRHILEELQRHLPYIIFSVAVGMVVLGVLTILIEVEKFPQASQDLFYVFHPLLCFLAPPQLLQCSGDTIRKLHSTSNCNV
jgi:hypothetical protein